MLMMRAILSTYICNCIHEARSAARFHISILTKLVDRAYIRYIVQPYGITAYCTVILLILYIIQDHVHESELPESCISYN